MADFNIAVQKLFQIEGGYSPSDAGAGAVKYGITQKFLDGINYPKKASDLTKIEAEGLYRIHFWNPLNLDRLSHQPLVEAIFFAAVNMGIRTAVKILQNTVYDLADGKLNDVTVKIIKERGEKEINELYRIMLRAHYITLARQKQFRGYLKGWLKRTEL